MVLLQLFYEQEYLNFLLLLNIMTKLCWMWKIFFKKRNSRMLVLSYLSPFIIVYFLNFAFQNFCPMLFSLINSVYFLNIYELVHLFLSSCVICLSFIQINLFFSFIGMFWNWLPSLYDSVKCCIFFVHCFYFQTLKKIYLVYYVYYSQFFSNWL